MNAIVYSKNNCINCKKTVKLLDNLGASYSLVKIDEDPEALQKVMDMGFRSAPVVVTSEDRWSGFDEKRIREFASGVSMWDF